MPGNTRNNNPNPEMAAPSPPHLWEGNDSSNVTVHYFVRHPWQWVMDKLTENRSNMTEVSTPGELPTAIQQKQYEQQQAAALAALGSPDVSLSSQQQTPSSVASSVRRRRAKGAGRPRSGQPSTLKVELSNPVTGEVDYAVHGTSSALDGLEDKDELVRTIQRCRCEHLSLSPPAILINWDVTHEECLNVVGKQLPALDRVTGAPAPGTKNGSAPPVAAPVPAANAAASTTGRIAVLKEPMGSQGKGIYFVRTAEEIHETINDHRQRAMAEPEFLDNLIAAKGRIPSWVLQAEVIPSLLIRDRRKFHIRTYMVVLEKLFDEDLIDIFIYNRHEVRIANLPVPDDEGTTRDRMVHITNGANSDTTERILLNEVPELTSRNMQEKVEGFVAETFGKHLLPDILRRVSISANLEEEANSVIRKFAIAGLDIMVTEDGRLFLLEVNVNPAAPPESTISDTFSQHLQGFLRDLVDLVIGHPSRNFIPVPSILEKRKLAAGAAK